MLRVSEFKPAHRISAVMIGAVASLSMSFCLTGCGGGESSQAAALSGASASLGSTASSDSSSTSSGVTDGSTLAVSTTAEAAQIYKRASAINANPMGINLYEPVSWASFPLFVDAIHDSRPFETPSGAPSQLDANGWPTADFRVILYEGAFEQWNAGTWTGSFTGKGTVNRTGGGTINNVVYNSSTNTTSFNLVVASGDTNLGFQVTGTSGGAQNITMRRPGETGLTGTYRPATTAFYGQFGYIRYMWFQDAWYDTQHTTWSTRTTTNLRTTPAYETGQGQALEQAIALSNAAKTGGWFHIPINADDDYVTQTANMLRSTMMPGLPIYIELGNEIWNGSGPLLNVALAKASAYNAAHPGVLNYDGETNQWSLADRWVAMRTKEISVLFQTSFGSNFSSRVRVLLANQIGWWRFGGQLAFVNKVYGPPANYFYAISSAPYATLDNSQFGGTNDTANMSLTTTQTLSSLSLNSANILTWAQLENTSVVAKKYGLKFVGYEGGPALSGGFAPATAGVNAAGMDPGMQTMVEDLLTRSFNAGMESFAFFEGGAENVSPYGARFSLASNYPALSGGTAPKLKALSTFATRGRPVPTRNVVAAAGAVIDGRAYADHAATGNYPTLIGGSFAPDQTNGYNIPYVFNCTTPGTYTITLNVTTTGTGSTNLELNGAIITKGITIPNTSGVAGNVTLGQVTLAAGLNYVSIGNGAWQGQVKINSLKF